MSKSRHERHIADARAVAERLPPFQRDVILRLCRSSASSMETNRGLHKDLLTARALLKKLLKEREA